jgi:hypothetical protein
MSPLGKERKVTRKDLLFSFPHADVDYSEIYPQAEKVTSMLGQDEIVVIPIEDEDRKRASLLRMALRNQMQKILGEDRKFHTLIKTSREDNQKHLLFISNEKLLKEPISKMLEELKD